MNDRQENLYDEWGRISDNIKLLRGIIQNDFDRLIEDGYLNHEGMNRSLKEFDSLYAEKIRELNSLKFNIVEFIHYKMVSVEGGGR